MTEKCAKRWPPVVAGLAAFMAPVAAFAAVTSGISDPAEGYNHLFAHVIADITVIGLVFGAGAAYLLWKYRATDPEAVGNGPKLTVGQAVALALIPAVVFMADDFFLAANGWVLFKNQRTVPVGALEIQLTANQFYWDFDYGNGVTATNEIKVPVGKPVVLRMISNDVIHSFFIPDFRIKEEVVPGRKTYEWFIAQKPGRTLATCAEYCGMGHPQMPAFIEAVPQAEFDAWMASQKHAAATSPVQAPNS